METPLTTRQQTFYDKALSGANLFLTGKAGTGKTTVLNETIKGLERMGKQVIKVAPTGIAATNIDGTTIHSTFGLTPYGILSFDECRYLSEMKRLVLRRADVIIIDEVSMLRPDILDGMHWTLTKNGCPGLRNKQVIFAGDLKQLPPTINELDRSVLLRTYNGDLFTYAAIYPRLSVETIELDEIKRQSDPDFIAALNVVRDGGRSPYFEQFCTNQADGVILAPHTKTVIEYNTIGLKKQTGAEFRFDAVMEGEAKGGDFSLDQLIKVKNGCPIIHLINQIDGPLKNGTIGTFISHDGCHFFRFNNTDFALAPVQITKKKYVYDKGLDEIRMEEIGKITQYPFRLAYALTIHKSQGLTFDAVTIDLRLPVFQRGQLYTALSRVRTPAGLHLITNKPLP